MDENIGEIKMSDNGLTINEEEFMSMRTDKKLLVLYQNQVKTFDVIKDNKKAMATIKFHQKIQYIGFGGIIATLGLLLDKIYGIFK